MAISKSVEMLLKINAIANLSALKGVNQSLMGIAKNAFGIGKILLGVQAFEGVAGYIKGMKEEAESSRAANERINIALKNRRDLMKETGGDVSKYGEQLQNLANSMERTGVTAATNLKAGFSGLVSAGFHPDVIEKIGKGFEGTVIALKGIGASQEDVTSVSGAIRNFIKAGTPLPKMFNSIMSASDKAKNSMKALGTEQERGKFVMQLMENQAIRVADALGTSAGKAESASLRWKAIQRTLGEPFLDVQAAFAEAMHEVAKALEPAAQGLAKILTPALKDFASWIRTITPEIQRMGAAFLEFFKPAKVDRAAFAQLPSHLQGAYEEMGEVPDFGEQVKIKMEGITKAILEYDWGTLLASVKEGTAKSMQGIGDAVSQFDWAGTFASIGEWFGKIDWVGIAASMGKGVGELMRGIANFIVSADWGAIGQAFWTGLTVVGEVFREAAVGFFSGLIEGFHGQKFEDLIKPLLDEVKTWPRKLIDGLAGVGEALLKVFTEAFASIVSAAGKMIGDVVSSITGGIQSFVSGGGVEKAATRAAEAGKTQSRGMPVGQLGGLFSHPTVKMIGEAGPEMLLPLNNKQRSQGLLAQTMGLMGMKGMGGGGPISVSVAPNITINGAEGAQGHALAREVERAMERPIQSMLDQLRKARDEERRLAYV